MHLSGPLRAAVGLAATAATEAKHLPDRAIELPMLVVSSALQASLRAQQRYARLTARGDEVLNRRTPTQEPPPWATFDEPVSPDGVGLSAFDQLFGVEDPTAAPDGREPVEEILPPDEPPVATSAAPPAAKDTPPAAEKAARKATKKVAAKKVGPRKVAAKKAAASDDDAFADPAIDRAKTVSRPRHAPPSAFDNVTDDTDPAR